MKQGRRIRIVNLTAQAGCVLGLLVAAGCPGDDGDAADTGTGPATSTQGADDGNTTDGGTPTTMPPGDDDGMPQTSSTGPGVEDDTTAGPIDTGSTGEPPEVPPGWTCDPANYGVGDGCDCGCGEPDLDCADATAASCEYCESCSPFSKDCSMLVDPADNSMCGTGRCGNMMLEGGEACDGTESLPPDFDCMGLGFEGGEVACSADCTNVDLTMCTGGPEGWTCLPEYFDADDGCDCGCGVVDPDCADMTSGSCEYCNNFGSCVAWDGDCSTIDAANNGACQ